MQDFVVPDSIAGRIDCRVFVPAGQHLPVVYLLHGRGGAATDWDETVDHISREMREGTIVPTIIVAVDGPWSDRGHWWVDSLFTGDPDLAAGRSVATALIEALLPAIDREFPTLGDREGRVVAGASMGGAGAVGLVLGHPESFSRAIALSPAVYLPEPPAESNARRFGAFGRGSDRFSDERYRELGYASQLSDFARRDAGRHPVRLHLTVGDHEASSSESEPDHDLTVETARLHARARRVPGISSQLRVVDGTHDMQLWGPALRAALRS